MFFFVFVFVSIVVIVLLLRSASWDVLFIVFLLFFILLPRPFCLFSDVSVSCFPFSPFLRPPGDVVVVGFVGSAFGVLSVVFPPGPSMLQFVLPMCPAHGPFLLLGDVVLVGFVGSTSEVLLVFSAWSIRASICFSKVSGA